MPKETILAAYQLIFPGVNSILECLIVFNLPFTFVKAMISVIVTFLIYKHISPVLKKIGQ
jgi:riboflavin transporter FmnP